MWLQLAKHAATAAKGANEKPSSFYQARRHHVSTGIQNAFDYCCVSVYTRTPSHSFRTTIFLNGEFAFATTLTIRSPR